MERQEASLKSPEETTKTVLADVTRSNCFRNVFPNDLYFALTNMSHLVSHDEVKGTIVETGCHSPKHREDKPEGLEFPPQGRLS